MSAPEPCYICGKPWYGPESCKHADELGVWASVRTTTKILAANGIVSTEEDERALYDFGLKLLARPMSGHWRAGDKL